MSHPLLAGTVVLSAGLAVFGLYRRERNRVRDVLERLARQDGLDALPVRRLERDPATGVYRLPDERG